MVRSTQAVALAGGLILFGLLLSRCESATTEPVPRPPLTATLVQSAATAIQPRATTTDLPATSPVLPAWLPSSQGIPAQIGVAALAVAPSEPATIYLAGYEAGGVYRSDDGGASWLAVAEGVESRTPLAVAVHPNDPDLAWVGTMVGGFRTTDGGEHWQPMPGLPQMPIYAVAVAPAGDLLFAAGEAAEVWRSEDYGQTWSASDLHAVEGVLSLAVDADGTVFAGTAGQGLLVSRDRGTSWQGVDGSLGSTYVTVLSTGEEGWLYAVAEGSLYLSDDGGEGWAVVGPAGFEALSFAAESGPGGRLYLGSRGNGLAVSPDGGRTWLELGAELRQADVTYLVTDPATPGRAYLGTRHNGLYGTVDGGKRWSLLSAEVGQPVVTALLQDPGQPDTLYAGALDGVYRSDDGGAHWRLVSGGMGRLLVQGLAASPTGDRIYAATRTGLYLSEDGGRTWHWTTEELGRISVFCVVVDPHDRERVYAGSWGHNVLRSTDGGLTWAPIHRGLETLSVHAFAVDPADADLLYAGTVEAVYRSTDGGEYWQASALAERPLTTFALAVAPARPTLVYAGTTDGVVRSADGGRTWQTAGRESLSATVTSLQADLADAQILYAGTEHHGLFWSTNGGEDWQSLGLKEMSVYAILVDPSGALWLGTDQGIFRRP